MNLGLSSSMSYCKMQLIFCELHFAIALLRFAGRDVNDEQASSECSN